MFALYHEHLVDKDEYGHGQVLCYDCLPDGQAQVVENIDHGYCVDALTQAEVDWLLTQAAEHEETHPAHFAYTYTFERQK